MLKSGKFLDKRGDIHDLYIQEDKRYYRIDILKPGTLFQVDPSGVEYSLIRAKKTLEYGEKSYLYAELQDYILETTNIKTEDTHETYWGSDGFYSKSVSINEKRELTRSVTHKNGSFLSEEIAYNKMAYSISITDDLSGKIEPINIHEYLEVTLESSIGANSKKKVTEPRGIVRPLAELKAMYDLRHIENNDFVVAHTLEIAQKRLQRWREQDVEFKSVDTETTGTAVNRDEEDTLVGIVLSYSTTESTYFPFFHEDESINLPIEFLQIVVEAIIEQAERECGHNIRFDRKVFLKSGYDVNLKYCTLILSILVEFMGSHSLKDLTHRIDGNTYLELDMIFYNKKDINFAKINDLELIKYYACPDTANTLKVMYDLKDKLDPNAWEAYKIESEAANCAADMEYFGMRYDVPEFVEAHKNNKWTLEALESEFRKATGVDGKLSSPEVIRDLLYNKMRCKVLAYTKANKPSTKGSVIDKLASLKRSEPISGDVQPFTDMNGKVIIKEKDLRNAKYPALLLFSKWREYQKRETAYYKRFERTGSKGRIYFWVNPLGAATTRQSSPMHQLPEELKEVILSDDPDWVFWDADYSAIELRWMFFLAGAKNLIRECNNPDNDIHRIIGSQLTGKRMCDITAADRSKGKRRNFGVIYGISKFGLAVQNKGPGATKADQEEAQESIDEFFLGFKEIDQYIRMNENKILTRHQIANKFYEYRRFPELSNPDLTKSEVQRVLRQGKNHPIQGSAALYLKMGQMNIRARIKEKGWDKYVQGKTGSFPMVRLALTVHDEAIVFSHKSIPYEEILEMFRDCMEIPIDGAPCMMVCPAKIDNFAGHDDDSAPVPVRLRDKLIDDYHRTGKSVFLPDGSNYKEILNNYRIGVLNDYMLSVIDKYGPDPRNVGMNIDHPKFTFDLLDYYKEDLKALDLEHRESIIQAATWYMEGKSGVNLSTEKDKASDVIQVGGTISNLMDYDPKGNVIYPESDVGDYDEAEEDDRDNGLSFVEDSSYDNTTYEKLRVWELFSDIVVDCRGLIKDDCNKVIAKIWEYRDSEGFYSVKLLFEDKTLDTRIRVANMDFGVVEDLVNSLEVSFK